MECKQISRLLDSYCDNQISNENRMAVECHLATCRECEMQVRTYRQSKDLFEPVSPPTSLESSVRAAMAAAAPKRPLETQMKTTFKFGGLAIGACTIATIALVAYPKKADAHAMYNRMLKKMQSVSSVEVEGFGKIPSTYVCTEGHAKWTNPTSGMAVITGVGTSVWYKANGEPVSKDPIRYEGPAPSPGDYVLDQLIKYGDAYYGPPQAGEPVELDGQEFQVLTRDGNSKVNTAVGATVRQVIAIDSQSGLPVAIWHERLDSGAWAKLDGGFYDNSGGAIGGFNIVDERIHFNVPVDGSTFAAPTPK